MPSSSHFHVSKMIDWLVQLKPQSVLDIGVGFGKWGFLSREYLDINAQHYDPQTWQVRIDGIEAFPEYATPTYEYIYNTVYFGDVRTVLATIPDYDLIIMGDVIEHFTKEEGRALLAQLRQKAKFVLISSPTVFFQQSLFGNDFETHRSLWTIDDFSEYEFDYDEYDRWVFVALVRGDKATSTERHLNSWPARVVYSQIWLKKHLKIAYIVKSLLRRVPQGAVTRRLGTPRQT